MDIAVDVISQEELRALWDLFGLHERVSAHIARRMALGATVEPGDYSAKPQGIDVITGESRSPSDTISGFNTSHLILDKALPVPAGQRF